MRRYGNYLDEHELMREVWENRKFRLFMYRWFEALVFVGVIVGSGLSIYFAYHSDDAILQSLLLNLGANLLVFVLLFWLFQYFLGRQPGSDVAEDSQYKDILVIPQDAETIESIRSPPTHAKHRRAKRR